MTWDLVVRGGVVVDGTGLSRRRGDVAVKDGHIAAVGHVPGVKDAARTLDAEGMIVAPGIVGMYIGMRTEQRIQRLRRRQRDLVEEWGPGVAGGRRASRDASAPSAPIRASSAFIENMP